MFSTSTPSDCASNYAGLSRKSDGEQADPAGGAAASAGSHSIPSGRTPTAHSAAAHEGTGASTPTPQSAAPTAGTEDAPTAPLAGSFTHGDPAGGATFSGVPVRAMEDVMAARMEQIVKFGHTPEKDRQTALYSARQFGPNGQPSLMHQITRRMSAAIEYASRGHGAHDIARRHLVTTAALCLAAIDWIDAELEELAAAASTPSPDPDDRDDEDYL